MALIAGLAAWPRRLLVGIACRPRPQAGGGVLPGAVPVPGRRVRSSYEYDGDDEGPFKSDTCFSSTGGRLTEYATEESARRGAAHARRRFGRSLKPYLCGRCDQWHLAPVVRGPLRGNCQCVSSDGTPKQTYWSREEAMMRAEMLSPGGLARFTLDVYPCPVNSRAWHIRRTA